MSKIIKYLFLFVTFSWLSPIALSQCLVDNFNTNIGACQPNGNYEITGFAEFSNPPATGQLIFEDCNGNQDIYNAPFTSPQNFTINAGAANGAPCDVTVYFSADPACTQNIPYTAPTCPCNIDQLNVNIGACDPATNTFELNGSVEFSFPPATGQLIVEDCNGNQQVFNAPFTSPQNFTISGITPDGATCSVTVYFTDNPACTITSNNYTNPNNCTCPADAGTYTYTNNGSGTNNYVLCENDEFFITPNGDQVMPNDVGPIGGVPYDPGIAFLIYSCPPSPGVEPALDPCFEGAFAANGGITDVNDMTFINSFPPGTFTNNTVYFAPMTMYNLPNLTYDVNCWNIGSAFDVQYLNPISETVTTDCQAGTATFTITGGYPEFNAGAVYTASNLTPVTAQFDNTTAGHNGTITISGLVDGDNYSFDIVDDNGCPYTITGGPFQGVEDASFSYPDNAYCQSAVAPVPNITGVTGGTFTSTPAGLDLDGVSGEVNLATSTPGTYDVTYTTPDPVCFASETVQITVIADPVVDPLADVTECDQFTLTPISGTNLSGNEAYYTGTGGTGTSYNPTDVITTSTTLYVYDETGTTPNCFDETSFNISINPTPSLDPIANQNACDSYTLPAISGTDLTPGVAYFDAPNGGGTTYNPGDNITTSGTYYVYDETGSTPNCFDEVTFDIVVTPSPNFTVSSNPPTSCTSNDAELIFSGLQPNTAYDVTYVDNGTSVGPQSFTSDNNGDIIITGLPDGTFTGFVITLGNCTGTDNSSINIVSPNNPTVGAGPDQSICEGESVTLTADNPDGATITWDNGVNDGVAFNPAVGSVTYTVTATNAQGCTATDEVVVTVNPLPTVDAGNDLTICEDGSVTLNGSGAQSYNWDNGVVDGIPFSPTSTATYTVTGTDANGCQNTDQVTVTVNPLPDVNFSAPITNGCAPLVIEFNNQTAVGSSCSWDFGNGLNSIDCDNVSMTYTTPGCYDVTLTVTASNGCTNELTLQNYICVEEAPVANFLYDPVRPLNTNPTVNFENLSQGATDYEWTFNDEDTSFSENPTHIFPTQSGEYPVELVAISEAGCTDTATSVVNVVEELIFYVPNTFTPDGNGKNEVFLPVMTSGFDPYDYELLIFNRWGELIFESRNPWVGWDGTFKGKTVQDGTYVWKITFKDEYLDDLQEVMGHVNVLR